MPINPVALASAKSLLQIETSINTSPTGDDYSATGTAVTGVGTAFDTEVAVGDMIEVSIGGVLERRLVTAIASATAMTIDRAHSSDPSNVTFDIIKYLDVEFVSNIDGPNLSANVIEVPNMTSRFIDKIGGLIDSGELSGTMYFQPRNAQHAAFFTKLKNQGLHFFILWLPDADDLDANPPPDAANSFWDIRGTITGFGAVAPVGEAISVDTTITISGEPILVAGPGV